MAMVLLRSDGRFNEAYVIANDLEQAVSRVFRSAELSFCKRPRFLFRWMAVAGGAIERPAHDVYRDRDF